MEGISVCSRRLPFTGYLRRRAWLGRECVRGESHGRAPGRATGMSEVRCIRGRVDENATREPESPAEADPCAVKRRVPQSLFPGASLGERARRKSRKVAGNTTGASARSRSSWEAEIGRNASSTCSPDCRKAARRGRASPSQTVRSTDVDDGSPSPPKDGSRGAVRDWAQSLELGRRGAGKPASERNGARASRQNVTGKA
jgi:hypothetical protein